MQMTIHYKRSKDLDYPFLATTEISGEYHVGAGRTPDEAKSSLIEKVTMWLGSGDLPPSETVEIPIANNAPRAVKPFSETWREHQAESEEVTA
jgi:hypothetical protein